MRSIAKDIGTAHKGDIDTAPPKTITEHWKEMCLHNYILSLRAKNSLADNTQQAV